jgi:AraC family transcriptional regulator
MSAQLAGHHMPVPVESVLRHPRDYQINMCLTPRPLYTRASYRQHWGPHRYESLGEIFLVPPGEELHVRGSGGEQATLTCHLEAAALHAVVGQDIGWTSQRLESAMDVANARIRALLYRIAEEIRHPGIAPEAMLDCLARQLAIELGRHFLEVVDRPLAGGLAAWRLRLIDERLNEDSTAPSLSQLANLCGLSVRQLTRGFRVSRGSSIGEYCEQRRMEAAKRRLLAGESVKTIACAMGFASPSSFTFAFRRATGISPSTFRARQRVPGTV